MLFLLNERQTEIPFRLRFAACLDCRSIVTGKPMKIFRQVFAPNFANFFIGGRALAGWYQRVTDAVNLFALGFRAGKENRSIAGSTAA
jgi:hypothetical protein